MPTVSRISVTPYNIPLKGALTWGSGHELRRLEHALIRVELSDGAVGYAEATPRPSIYGETQASALRIIEAHLAPMLLGETVDSFAEVSALAARAAIIKNNNTARGALDMALHQALAHSRGESLAAYLGATRRQIRLSAIVSTGAAEAVAADVAALYQAGVRVFKVKIGRDISGEIMTITELIQGYPDAQFYVDANETLASDSAAAILTRLREWASSTAKRRCLYICCANGGNCGAIAPCPSSRTTRPSQRETWRGKSPSIPLTSSISRRRARASRSRRPCWTCAAQPEKTRWSARKPARCWAACTRRFSLGAKR